LSPNLRRSAALLAAFLFCGLHGAIAQTDKAAAYPTQQILLTPSRLRRLKRDRERQTERWTNFERRVQSVRDSPERGFELALYYAVTGDEQSKKEAADWVGKHPCELRQVSLVANWMDVEVPAASQNCPAESQNGPTALRDRFFLRVALGKADEPESPLPAIEPEALSGKELYSLLEYLDAVRTVQRTDLREPNPSLFADLPVRFLLALKPAELDHPAWESHVAALALVSLDPNLTSSQFLQGWALEDRFENRDGPGVAYEFLWANPYLPGVSYENMQPWWYGPDGRLLARTGWAPDACWISIKAKGTDAQNCPTQWESKTAHFGNLTLVPMTENCAAISSSEPNVTVILWKLKPGEKVGFRDHDQRFTNHADDAGLWRVPANVTSEICRSR
jgi:hypothetical protein